MPPNPYNNTPKNSNTDDMQLFSFENNSIQKTGLNPINNNNNKNQKNAISQALKELQTKNDGLVNKILALENQTKDQEKKEVRYISFYY